MVTKQFKNIQKHFQSNGLVPREHGLTGHLPATTYSYEAVSDGVHFICAYAEIFGKPQPAARYGRATNPPIYLPASNNYKSVHSKYIEVCMAKDPHARFLKYKPFVSIWKRCLFMTPQMDVCAKFEMFCIRLRDAVNDEDKVKLTIDSLQ